MERSEKKRVEKGHVRGGHEGTVLTARKPGEGPNGPASNVVSRAGLGGATRGEGIKHRTEDATKRSVNTTLGKAGEGELRSEDDEAGRKGEGKPRSSGGRRPQQRWAAHEAYGSAHRARGRALQGTGAQRQQKQVSRQTRTKRAWREGRDGGARNGDVRGRSQRGV